MSARLEKCSECGRVYVRHSETGKFHPRYRAEQICYECAEQGAALVSASIQSSGPGTDTDKRCHFGLRWS